MSSPTMAIDTDSLIEIFGIFPQYSRSSRNLDNYIHDISDNTDTSITFDHSYSFMENSLNDVAMTASVNNWDGYGAEPVNEFSFFLAKSFLHKLPSTYPKPEISVDPDGEISFEWLNGDDKIFSISFSEKNEISFAGIFSTGEIHGIEEFSEYEIPKKIFENIKRLYL